MPEGKRILVVDDEPIVTRSCKRVLSDEGYQVETTESGVTGLSLAREGAFDLMLTDLKMPDLDGMKIVQFVRRERAEMPVVIITGYGTPETKAQARQLGVVAYIEKPFDPEQITEAVLQAWKYAESDEATVAAKAVPADVKELAAKYGYDESALIQILLDIQNAHGYLPKECLFGISVEMEIPLNRIYKAATFYKAFSLEPRGKHLVQVCTGTACHVRGAPTLATRAAGMLEIRPGKTTKDGLFSLETVNCLGCCALGPVMAIDGKYYSNPSQEEITEILNTHRQETE